MSQRKWKEITVDSNSEVWDKEDPIEGKLVKTETDVGPNQSNMFTILTDDGEVKVWGSTVLDDKLLGVPNDTYVKIEYEGKLKSKKGTEYHSYKVFVDESVFVKPPVFKEVGEPTPEEPPDFLQENE